MHHWGSRPYWKYNNVEENCIYQKYVNFDKKHCLQWVGFHTSCVSFYLQKRAGLVGCWAFA